MEAEYRCLHVISSTSSMRTVKQQALTQDLLRASNNWHREGFRQHVRDSLRAPHAEM